MDALSAAAQRVEASQRERDSVPPPPARSADLPAVHGVRITAAQQQPWYEQMDGQRRDAASPSQAVTTPTMRITDILNDEPMEGESDDLNVMFVGAAAAPTSQTNNTARLIDPHERAQWRNSSHDDLASASASTVNIRSRTRLSNGDVPITAGEGFTGISWPPGAQRSNVFDSRVVERATAGGRQQQQRSPPPAVIVVPYPLHTQQQLQQQSPTKTDKKPVAKRERAPKSRVVVPAPAHAPVRQRSQSPVARAAPITKTGSVSMANKKEARKMWADAEKAAFDKGFRLHGPNWIKIAEFIGTRTHASVASYGKRHTKKLESKSCSVTSSGAAGGNGGAGSFEPQHDVTLDDANGDNGTEPSLPDPVEQVVLAAESVNEPVEPMAVRVLDLSCKDPPQRPRRGARHQETTVDAITFAPDHFTPSAAPAPVPAAVVNDVIEINTEESATETPQKAPRRVATRPPRAREQRRPLSSPTANDSSEVVVKQPKRKKPKLTLNLNSGGASDAAPPVSPSSSSVTSGSGLIGSSALKPKKRGKKRPQQEFDGITDSPTTLFSSYSSSSDDGRKCEFCNIARGVCATMHCTQCKRLYHTKCFVNHFRPHCQIDGDEPIEAQLKALRLDAPPQVNVKMLRCAPCHAVLLDNIKRDGYAWDCDCPSCLKPQKLVDYRREMVIQFLVHRVDEKQPKAKSKGSSKQTGKDDASGGDAGAKASTQETKKPAAQPTRTGTRRTRNNNNSAVVPRSENESVKVDSEVSIEVVPPVAAVETPVVVAASGKKQARGSKKKEALNGVTGDDPVAENVESKVSEKIGRGCGEPDNDDELSKENDVEQTVEDTEMDDEANAEENDVVAEPDQEKEAGSSRSLSVSKSPPAAAAAERDAEPELTDEELLAAVPVSLDGNFETFRVVCTETPSLTASGVMKEGMYFKYRRGHHSQDSIFCPCCEKRLTREQFVRHTDGAFLSTETLRDNKTSWDFLFARHYDGSASPLQRFLQILDRRPNNSNKKSIGGVSLSSKQNKKSLNKILSLTSTAADVVKAEDVVETAKPVLKVSLKQLESVFIARRAPGSADSKASSSSNSSSSGSSSSSKPAFVIRLVCVSSELTIPMHDGLVQNKLDRSTPGDFPHKDGWLFFDKGTHGTGSSKAVTPSYAHVLCDCCAREMDLGDFILHTGVVTRDVNLKFKRRYVYVPQRDNPRALLDLDRIWQAVLTLYKHQALDDFMSSVPSVVLRL